MQPMLLSAKCIGSRLGNWLTLEDAVLESLGCCVGWGTKGRKQQGVR